MATVMENSLNFKLKRSSMSSSALIKNRELWAVMIMLVENISLELIIFCAQFVYVNRSYDKHGRWGSTPEF